MSQLLTAKQLSDTYQERREEKRADIDVSIRVVKLSDKQYDLYLGAFEELRRKFAMSMMYFQETQRARLLLRKLKGRLPEVAAYAETLEKRIKVMGEFTEGHLQLMSEKWRQTVNVSASGLRYRCNEVVGPGDKLFIRIAHTETDTYFLALGASVYTQQLESSSDYRQLVGVRFSKYNNEDLTTLKTLIASHG